MTTPVKTDVTVAVLGAGRWGRNLVRNLYELGALDAVVDPRPEVRSEIEATYPGVAVLAEAKDAFASDVNAVVIATPAVTHASLALAAVQAGKDVFVEKPFSLSVEEAERVVREAYAAERILMVGHMLLYQPAVRWIRRCVGEGLIGSLIGLHQERLNLGTVRTVENVLWSLGVHDVAALLYLIGEEVLRVTAWGQRALQEGIEDDMYLHLQFESGVEGHLHASWLWPERRRRLSVVGTDAMLVYDEEEHVVVLHRRHVRKDLSVEDLGAEVVFTGEVAPLRAELEHLLECIRTRATPISDGESALRVIRVLDQASTQLSLGSPLVRRG
ncbi:MAG: Gfo/Idh/MocA family oxidoreductase [Actinomycetota bacterium]|nr:Gfo/Idh/MocA family oxidoreductase [Actinomycetota bacterium]